ncbi:hypothetical protein C8Q70DRAFT_225136 [Cubamyces menziesii]|nr:hypothetical protein C8Q70DRAFT_225136 [Cubamyces menziesii]
MSAFFFSLAIARRFLRRSARLGRASALTGAAARIPRPVRTDLWICRGVSITPCLHSHSLPILPRTLRSAHAGPHEFAPDSVHCKHGGVYGRSAIPGATRHHSHHALPCLRDPRHPRLAYPSVQRHPWRSASPDPRTRAPLGPCRKPSWAVCANAGHDTDSFIISTAYHRGIRQSPVSHSHARHPALLRQPSLDLARCASTASAPASARPLPSFPRPTTEARSSGHPCLTSLPLLRAATGSPATKVAFARLGCFSIPCDSFVCPSAPANTRLSLSICNAAYRRQT